MNEERRAALLRAVAASLLSVPMEEFVPSRELPSLPVRELVARLRNRGLWQSEQQRRGSSGAVALEKSELVADLRQHHSYGSGDDGGGDGKEEKGPVCIICLEALGDPEGSEGATPPTACWRIFLLEKRRNVGFPGSFRGISAVPPIWGC